MTPLEASTVCLLQFDAATVAGWTDASPARRKLSQVGSAVTVSAASKFGAYCYEYSGPAGNYEGLYAGKGPGCGTGGHTIEAFVYLLGAQPAASTRVIFQVSAIGTNSAWLGIDGTSGKLKGSTGNGYILSDAAVPTNQWVHVAITQDAGSVTRLFVDGVMQSSVITDAAGRIASNTQYDLCVGSQYGNSQTSLIGRVDQVRYVIGYALYTSTFTPPTSAYADCPAASQASPAPAPVPRRAQLFSTATHKANPLVGRSLRDTYFGGTGKVSGQVVIKGTPDAPVRRRVRLFRDRDGACVRETMSDAATGAYLFPNIDATVRYTVVAYDDLHSYRAVIADNLTPDPMP